jgi:NADH:ubiquinone oxidoreductase subunit 3 (subunit A)
MIGGCVSEIEKVEEEYRVFSCTWNNAALVWAGFAVTEFVLITTLFTAFKVETNILLELTIALTVIDALFFTSSASVFMGAANPAHRLRKVKDKKTGKPVANPRQLLVERAERLLGVGMVLQSLVVCVFLAFLEMYWVLAIVVVVSALLYIYIMPLTPFVGKDEPRQN